MRKLSIITLFLAVSATINVTAQTTGSVGIRTITPSSTLTVNGSISLMYKSVATNYTLTDTDYYVVYTNPLVNGVITLPVSVSGVNNIKGRIYTIKNTTSNALVNVNANGAELIDGASTVVIPSNGAVQLINTGLTGAASTWEIVSITNANAAVSTSVFSVQDSASQNFPTSGTSNFNNGVVQTLTFSTGTVTVNSGGIISSWNNTTSEATIAQAGIYKIEGFANFNSGGTLTGTNSAGIGINIAFSKNDTVISATRFNYSNLIASNYNNSLLGSTVQSLAVGDRIKLVEYRGFGGDSPAPICHNPIGVGESKRLTITRL